MVDLFGHWIRLRDALLVKGLGISGELSSLAIGPEYPVSSSHLLSARRLELELVIGPESTALR